MSEYREERMAHPVIDKQLMAIARCMEAMEDFANFERWQILDFLAMRYGRTSYVLNPDAPADRKS